MFFVHLHVLVCLCVCLSAVCREALDLTADSIYSVSVVVRSSDGKSVYHIPPCSRCTYRVSLPLPADSVLFILLNYISLSHGESTILLKAIIFVV